MTVSKRRITVPERQARTAADIAARVAHQWTAIEATLAALAPATMQAAGSNPGRGSGHADPTVGVALANDTHTELCEAISAALVQWQWIEQQTHRVMRQHPDLAREADATLKALRCDDPLCTDNAVRRGKCWPHYRLMLELERSNDTRAISTEMCYVPASLDTSVPVEPLLPATAVVLDTKTVAATCGKCGRHFAVTDADAAHAVLAEHHARGCAA